LGAVLAPIWSAAGWAVQALGAVLDGLSKLPFATISIAASAGWISVLAVFGGILMVMRLPWALRWAGLMLVLPVFLLTPQRPAAGEFALLGADVGQGNALLVQTANHSLLYDAGPRFSRESDAGQRTIVPLLRALGERLDMVLISHRDADHIGGAAAVLKMQPQARLLSSIEAAHELQQTRLAERCVSGLRWQWDGVDFEIVHPQPSDYIEGAKPNTLSCVLRISNGRQTVLLTGDLEAAQEQRLVAQGAPLKADLLLMPHHGSKTSSTPEFLDAVAPAQAWVQAGYRNRFAHPVPSVLERYAQRGIAVVRSDQCGAAHWRSSEPAAVRCQREIAKRYWHHRAE
jgi:competence protein ComEC